MGWLNETKCVYLMSYNLMLFKENISIWQTTGGRITMKFVSSMKVM